MKCNSPGLLFCTILFPNHISGLFSQGQDMSLPGTKQQSGVDGGYPAESAVRCDKLMANLTRRCCQAGRGGSCSPRDSLSLLHTLTWHGNLFQASLRRCLRALISPERWSMDGGGAETSCRWSPVDLSQQRGSAVNDCSQGWLSHCRGWKSMIATCGLKSEISSPKAVFFFLIWHPVMCFWVKQSSTVHVQLKFQLKIVFSCYSCQKSLTMSRFSPYPCQSYPCALWLPFIQPQFTETNHWNSERCRHRFTEFEIVPGRPPPSSCLCATATEMCLSDCFWKPALTWKQLPKL